MDIFISIVLLILLAIPLLIIGIAIKIESKGPAIFKQIRTGKDAKEFYLYKFRSMEAANDVHNLEEENKVTKLGKFIRKTSLDELPQIFNILKGDMSLIGPRPWIPEYYENFTEHQKKRVKVRPGITGLAQAVGRNNLSVFEKIDYDIKYIENLSFIMDMKVIFMTIKTIFKREGYEISKFGIDEEIKQLKDNLKKQERKK